MYENQKQWDLVVLNPSFVLGPSLNPKFNTSESYNIIKQIGEGFFKFGIPKNTDCFGRYIVNSSNTNFYELSQLLYKSMEKNIQYQKNMHQNG